MHGVRVSRRKLHGQQPAALQTGLLGVITQNSSEIHPMSFFDRFRAKWKHPDPAVREVAVSGVRDQSVLEKLAETDPVASVRMAAVRAIKDPNTLARIAAGDSTAAVPAMVRLEDAKLITKIAQSAASHAVREMAVERIDDSVTLHRISTSDTDARVRLKARSRLSGPDPVRDFIRDELSKLNPTSEFEVASASFRGTLDEVAARLIGDARFRINGWLDHEIPGIATVRNLEVPEPSFPPPPVAADGTPTSQSARFLAFKRSVSGEPEEPATSNVYYEIRVWRVDAVVYLSAVEEKSLKFVADAGAWNRVSNSTQQAAPGST